MEQITQTAGKFTRRVGNTNYNVQIYYDESSTESPQGKFLRLIRNEAEKGCSACCGCGKKVEETGFQNSCIRGTICLPQMSRSA